MAWEFVSTISGWDKLIHQIFFFFFFKSTIYYTAREGRPWQPLLFLLPPSCMVAPIGKFANKFSFSPNNFSISTTASNTNSPLPTMSTEKDIGMDIQKGRVPSSNHEVRGRNPLTSNNSSRDSSMVSSGRSTPYHDRMDTDMDIVPVNIESNNERLELSYETEQENAIRVSMVTNQQVPTRLHNVNNEATPTHARHEDDVINIQLPYDPNAPTEPELWSGSFNPISLHGSMEYLIHNTKNIKVTLDFMAKYIQNKKVNDIQANDVTEFKGMGDAIWNFISSVYEAKWDFLYTDCSTRTLRSKISSKFTLRTPPAKSNGNKEIPKSNLVTINKMPPPLPPLSTKPKKEINTILKYFQLKNQLDKNKAPSGNLGKSYAQATKSSVTMSDVLKIKEAFPSLNAKKVDQVNNIVNRQSKPRPCIKMTMKGPFRKHIIIPMSAENVFSFMKNSSTNVANINRQLQNTKTDLLVDYIRSDSNGIIIVINKVAQPPDLTIIDQFIKNSNDINALQVEELRLSKSKSYLKIIGIPFYPHANSQDKLTSADIKIILQQNYIFDNVILASKSRVIKVSPKSDMAIVWIDIWDVQSGQNVKMLINRCFNVGNYIAMIRGANMNPGVLQCKNCWKWGHSMFSCRI